jgi:hypothetical protein
MQQLLNGLIITETNPIIKINLIATITIPMIKFIIAITFN